MSAAECGTVAGCHRHYRDGEKPCEPCSEAHRIYERDRRATKGRTAEYARRSARYRTGRSSKPALTLAAPHLPSSPLPCRQDPDAWFPEAGDYPAIEAAKKACRSCPVLAACHDWVMGSPQEHGVWAAMSERERRRLKKAAA